MAGIYSPSVTNFPEGVVSVVSTDNTSYSTVVQSMGSFNYGISSMYVSSNDSSQLMQPMTFVQYDSNGNIQKTNQIIPVDPYQYQSSSFFDLSKENIVLNGRTSLTFPVLSSENVSVVFYTKDVANKDFLPPTDFFKDDFFTGYAEVL